MSVSPPHFVAAPASPHEGQGAPLPLTTKTPHTLGAAAGCPRSASSPERAASSCRRQHEATPEAVA